MGFDVVVTVAPTRRVVEVEDARTYLRIGHHDDDAELERFIDLATEIAQEYCHQQFISATRVQRFDAFSDTMRLAYPPLIAVSTVQYVDNNGATQTLSSSNYTYNAREKPGRVDLAYGYTWPTTRTQDGAVTITYTCGYGATPDLVPGRIRQGVLMIVKAAYDEGEETAFAIGSAIVPGAILTESAKAMLSAGGRFAVL